MESILNIISGQFSFSFIAYVVGQNIKNCPGQKTSEIKLNMLHNYFLVSENIKHTDFYFWKIIEHFEIILIKLITQFYDRIYILRTISNIFCSYTSIYQNLMPERKRLDSGFAVL